MNIETSNILVKGLKDGDKDSFEKIFRHYYSNLVNYCKRYVNDDDAAQEIVQDIFTKLWLRHSELNINISLKSYLYKAVQNHSLNYINYIKHREKYQNNAGLSPLHSNNTPLEIIQENDIRIRMEKAVLTMPEKCREVFELKRYEGLMNKEIAQQLGISIKTVEKHMTKAISVLKNALQEFIN